MWSVAMVLVWLWQMKLSLYNGTLEVESQENLGTAVTISHSCKCSNLIIKMCKKCSKSYRGIAEQHITDAEMIDTSDAEQNQSNRGVEERNNN